MKKIFLVIVLAVLATTAAEAQLQNTVFKAKFFISDKQTSIGEHDTEIFSYPVSDRKIEIDSIHGLARIELPTGTKLRRVIKFVEHSYESFGKVYNGYYQTNANEKIYIRENEIGFHAFSTLGMFFTFHLKGTKERNDVKEKEEKLEIFIPNGPRLGNKVIEAKQVAKAYGDKLLFDDLNFMLPPNGIVGVIGPNGAGKTTLFRLIMGLETVDKGEFEVGETVKVAYVDQQHRDIDPNKSVYQVISGGNELIRMGGRDVNARAYLSRFNFSGGDQEKLCGVLSGGERNRLHLAMALKEEGNVLLLDEPTNDIDVNTLRALEEGLEDFAGCAVVISHDRWFLDRICTHILAFEGDSNVFYFEGSYSEYEENKMKRLGNEEPKRVRYRKLMTD